MPNNSEVLDVYCLPGLLGLPSPEGFHRRLERELWFDLSIDIEDRLHTCIALRNPIHGVFTVGQWLT